MKLFSPLLALGVATSLAFVAVGRAQIQTYETISSYSGSSQWSILNNRAAGELFTEVLGIQSLTYNFFNNGSSSATQLSAKFAEWNGTGTPNFNGSITTVNSRFTTLVDFGTFTVPQFTGGAEDGWESYTNDFGTFDTFEKKFDFEFLPEAVNGIFALDGSKTYALIISNTSGATTSFGIGLVAKPEDEEILPNTFVNGYAGIGNNSFGTDYTFSQIAIIPTSAVPESSTVAALLGCGLVAALVGYRIRQRRQSSPAGAAA